MLETTDPAEMALFIVTLMNFAFGGKRIENNLAPLTYGFTSKSVSAKPGPSIGNYAGYLHSFLTGPTLTDTLLLNLFSMEQIRDNPYWKSGLGTLLSELMPEEKDCSAANNLKNSYMATLLSLSRFVLLDGEGIYYVEGLQYPGHKEGWREPGMTVNNQEKQPKVLWVDPEKRPWRELPSMLVFLGSGKNKGFECQFIRYGLTRATRKHQQIGIWSGGLRISANSGDQSVKQDNDFVEFYFLFDSAEMNELWYEHFKREMKQLDQLSQKVYAATRSYFYKQKMDGGELASNASGLFWQLCERRFPELIDACYETEKLPAIRKATASLALQSYDAYCPKETARQIDAWAKCRPHDLENSKQKNMNKDNEKKSRGPEAFVPYVIALCQKNKGAAAALRRADNPATETQSWEYLAQFVDLDKPDKLAPYAAIAAAIARADIQRDGTAGIGKAIALCYSEKSESAPAQARFRRLLACDSVEEACRILRPLFSLIDSKAAVTLDYSRLLRELIRFGYDCNNAHPQPQGRQCLAHYERLFAAPRRL